MSNTGPPAGVTGGSDAWIMASPALAAPGCALDDSQIGSWRDRGFAFVSGVFPESLITTLATAALEVFPTPGSAEAGVFTNFGSELHFPSSVAGFNELTLHPRLLAAVAGLLDVPVTDVRLTQSDLWPKYGRDGKVAGALDNADQRMHIDYPNHSLAHPAEWERPEAVELIVYLSDVDDCAGATAVVPRTGSNDPAYRWPIVDSPGIAELDYVNDRQDAERCFSTQRPELAAWRASLYERERCVRYRPGDVLFYRHDTWHRGTPLRPGALRLVQNLTFRRTECEWISTLHVGWAWSAYRRSKFLEKLISGATLEQRAVLGFPQPGSSYWTPATIEAVGARYGVFGMDMTPYREALGVG